MSNRDIILATIAQAELCDDCLSVSSGVRPRQSVNIVCRKLSDESTILRHFGKCSHCHKAKIVNRPFSESAVSETFAISQSAVSKESKPWYWEGNIQNQVIEFLAKNNFSISSSADTASRESGKDIVCTTPSGNELWVSVKGYPESSANTQARHWFSQAIFDLVLYRGENSNVELALAFPDDFVTYANLLPRVIWLKQTIPFKVFWVSKDGTVRIE